MVTITCKTKQCPNEGIEINFGGHPDVVECGGCHCMLEPSDYLDDPEPPVYQLGEITE